MRACMDEAGRLVLAGRVIVRTDVTFVRHPDRYSDPRGAEMWGRVMALLEREETADGMQYA